MSVKMDFRLYRTNAGGVLGFLEISAKPVNIDDSTERAINESLMATDGTCTVHHRGTSMGVAIILVESAFPFDLARRQLDELEPEDFVSLKATSSDDVITGTATFSMSTAEFVKHITGRPVFNLPKGHVQ